MAALASGGGKALSTVATVLSGIAPVLAGTAAKKSADQEAEQIVARAKARRAEGGAAAREELRQSRLIQSRAQAVAAAQGADLSDPSLVNNFGDLAAEGQYRALARLYEGEDEARGLEAVARARKKEGRASRTAGYVRSATNVLTGVASLKGKYV
jgi:hypothetical protein